MTRIFLIVGLCGVVVANPGAQASPSRVIMGTRISGGSRTDASSQTVVETATLAFDDATGRNTYTIEFAMSHARQAAASGDSVVDLSVMENLPADTTPGMTLRINDDAPPVVTRLRSRRSVVATIPAAEFNRITRAGAVSVQTFDVTLRFGPVQLAMLRALTDRWFNR